uniref:Uncharacterized protein n=1 Tax=Heterorhabditis bacteriophora TaxID=37862 RepID=A0A1I7WZQ2_HETBA
MSGDHCTTSGVNKKCECGEEDCETERLWSDFEHCAQTVTRLYRDPTWKCLQTAAASTTQLYKEVLAAFTTGSKIDLNALLDVLYKNMRMASDDGQRRVPLPAVSGETIAAVHLFQQALTPNASASPQRGPELNAFLASQVQRHRKRQRSPSSPSSLIKRLRRT